MNFWVGAHVWVRRYICVDVILCICKEVFEIEAVKSDKDPLARLVKVVISSYPSSRQISLSHGLTNLGHYWPKFYLVPTNLFCYN